MKTVFYLAPKAWKEIKPETLQKTWKKLWPNIPQEIYEGNENQPNSNNDFNFIQVFQELEGCADVEESDISEWISTKQ